MVISIDMLTVFSSTSLLIPVFPPSRGWRWRAPPHHRLLPSKLPSTKPCSPATPRTPPSLERRLKAAPTEAQALQPKAPVKTEQLAHPVLGLLSRDKRSKPKKSQKTGSQRAARSPTSQPAARSAFSPQSPLWFTVWSLQVFNCCWNHFSQASSSPAPRCVTPPRMISPVYAVWPGNHSLHSCSIALNVCFWLLPAALSLGLFGNCAVHLQVHECLYDLL